MCLSAAHPYRNMLYNSAIRMDRSISYLTYFSVATSNGSLNQITSPSPFNFALITENENVPRLVNALNSMQGKLNRIRSGAIRGNITVRRSLNLTRKMVLLAYNLGRTK